MADPQGLAFDPVAADYDRGRAGWPDEVADGVAADEVLDLAAGTGKLTAALVQRFPRVVAVEPSEGMLAVLRRSVPTAEAVLGSAEAIPLDDDSVDAAFVAEAAHWFDPVAAGTELARVVRPGGTVTVCFNQWRSSFALPPAAEAAVREVSERAGPPGGPKVASGAWRAMFDGWPPVVEEAFDHAATFSASDVASYYVSVSNVARLPVEQRERLRARLLELLPDEEYRLELTARLFRTKAGRGR